MFRVNRRATRVFGLCLLQPYSHLRYGPSESMFTRDTLFVRRMILHLDKSGSYFQDSLLIFILECGLIFIRHNGHIQIGREQVVSEHFLSDGGQGFPF